MNTSFIRTGLKVLFTLGGLQGFSELARVYLCSVGGETYVTTCTGGSVSAARARV